MNNTQENIEAFLKAGTPVYCYEIYNRDGIIMGHKIDHKHWSLVKRDYDYNFDLQGKAARYILVTEDYQITREEAVQFAKAVFDGKLRRIHVELRDL